MKYWVTFLLVNCLFISSYAQHATLFGTIKLEDGTPVPFANVSIPKINKFSVSDDKGHYELKGVSLGQHELQVSSIEIEAKTFNIQVRNAKQSYLITVNAAKDTELKEVLVRHKSEKKEIETKGFAVNVIETKQVAFQSVQTNELLDQSAGVRIRQDGGLGSRVQYNLNGLSGNSIRIFIDGVPISNYGSSFSLNSLPPSMIERIEVYKGVVPTYLSEDALGGAINVVLNKKLNNSLTVSYSGGSFNTHQSNISGNYRNQKNGFTVNGSMFYNYSDNSYKVWGDDIYTTDYYGKKTPITAKRFHDGYQSVGGKFDIGFTNVKWADQFLLSAVLSANEKEVQHGATMRIVYGNRTTDQQSAIGSLVYSKKNFLVSGLNVNANASFSDLTRGVVDTIGHKYIWDGSIVLDPTGNPVQWATGAEGSNKSLQKNYENNFVGRANVSYMINRNNNFYANYLTNSFKRDQDDAMLDKAERAMINTRDLNKSILGFTYENLAFENKLRTNVFYKHYFQKVSLMRPLRTTTGGVTSISTYQFDKKMDVGGYGLAISYELIPRVFILLSAEKALRLPEATELFGNDAENIGESVNLNPESSNNLNVGFNLGPFKKDLHTLSFNTTFFYRMTKGMIRQAVANANAETYAFENLESVKSRGFDLELNYNYNRKLFFTFNTSYFNGVFNTQYNHMGEKYLWYGSQLRNEPFFKFNSNVSYYLNDLISKDSRTAIIYTSGFVNQFYRDWAAFGGANKSYIPTQFVHNIGLTYTFPNRKITLGFDAKNIFNQQVFDNWALQKPGRGFYGKVTYSIF
jgi:outer membrane receptor protein involved in Fe transport